MKRMPSLMLLAISASTIAAQTNCDSLRQVWQDRSQPDTNRLRAVYDLGWDCYLYSNPDSTLHYARLQLEYAERTNQKEYVTRALNAQGTAHWVKSDYPQALANYQRCLKIHEIDGNKQGMASLLGNIGLIYVDQGNFPLALEHQQRALQLREGLNDSLGTAIVHVNLGNIFNSIKEYDKAIKHYEWALAIHQQYNREQDVALILNNLGLAYFYSDNYSRALNYYGQSLEIQEKNGNQVQAANSIENIGLVYYKLQEFENALVYFKRSLRLHDEIGGGKNYANCLYHVGMVYYQQKKFSEASKTCSEALMIAEEAEAIPQQKLACECLYSSYKSSGNMSKALEYFERATILKDSLFNEENTKKLTQLEMQYTFDKKEAAIQAEQEKKDAIAAQELKRQKMVRNGFVGGFMIVLLFAGLFLVQRNRIGKEKERSEELLLNILPEETAQELKIKGYSEARLMEEVTVLFTDFKGFTALSEKVTPKELVADLHECFSAFDRICEKYGIEKIKTIGDAYMAAGGLPSPNNTHAKDVVQAALEMAEVIEEGRTRKIEQGLPFFEIRIGVHSGPVVAGIVGVKKFQYDIWGDTVNTASRMESSGQIGNVNISEATYQLLKNHPELAFKNRGKIAAKGKGELEMYFVSWV